MKTEDFLIIGCGPGALQLAYFFERQGRNYTILERARHAGAFFDRYPRHGQLLSINKVHTGYREACRRLRYDWNSLLSHDPELVFPKYSESYFPAAKDYGRYLRDFAKRFELKIAYGAEVERVRRSREGFHVAARDGRSWRAERVVLATGLSALNIPDIPGIEHAVHYADFSTDPEDFRDQRVLILGKGNSAFETANALNERARSVHLCSPDPVRLAWETHYVGHVRAVNNDFIDTYQLKSQNAILDAEVENIERRDGEYRVRVRFTHAADQTLELGFDQVLLATGFKVDVSMFDASCRPELMMQGKYPKMDSSWESNNVPGLFFAGGLMHARDFHKTMSSFIHGFRHNIDALARILAQRDGLRTLEGRTLPHDRQLISRHAAMRASMSAELFLQPGFLCDAYRLERTHGCDRGEDRMVFYRGLPLDYVREHILGEGQEGFVTTLEFGSFGDSPLAVLRDPRLGQREAYLHPVVRRIVDGRVADEHDLPDNLENDWGPISRFQIQRSLGLRTEGEPLDAAMPYARVFADCFVERRDC